MAHLQMRATRRQPEARLQGKVHLVRHLYTRGYTRQEILDLFRFIDWVLTLPQAFTERFQVALTQLEAETQMPYITSLERLGIDEGLLQGERVVLLRQLTRRFGPLPAWFAPRLEHAGREELEQWADRVLEVAHLEEVFGAGS